MALSLVNDFLFVVPVQRRKLGHGLAANLDASQAPTTLSTESRFGAWPAHESCPDVMLDSTARCPATSTLSAELWTTKSNFWAYPPFDTHRLG